MTTPPLPPDEHPVPDPPEPGSSADQEFSMPDHLALDDLADLAVGEPAVDASTGASTRAPTGAEAHLAACPACRAELEQLSAQMQQVSARLGAQPLPVMPVTVAARLDRVLAAEADARLAAGGAGGSVAGGGAGRGGGQAPVLPLRQPIPLKAPASATYVKQTGVVKIMLAAAVAAAVVGFGGYVLSATAGLNEPSALSPTQVHPDALADQAKSLAESRDLDAHPFSEAWRCARQVTAGRVTGITPVYVSGEQAYLVYTRSGGITYATLVTGCAEGSPTAGDRVALE